MARCSALVHLRIEHLTWRDVEWATDSEAAEETGDDAQEAQFSSSDLVSWLTLSSSPPSSSSSPSSSESELLRRCPNLLDVALVGGLARELGAAFTADQLDVGGSSFRDRR